MLLTTTPTVPGREFVVLGLVKGTVVQSKNVARDFMAGLKSVVGGEIRGYTEMMSEARDIATRRMVEEAQRMGADAVIMMQYSASAIMQNAAEILAYGTAVKFTN